MSQRHVPAPFIYFWVLNKANALYNNGLLSIFSHILTVFALTVLCFDALCSVELALVCKRARVRLHVHEPTPA